MHNVHHFDILTPATFRVSDGNVLTRAPGMDAILFWSLKSQVVYSKQPKLGLTQEFVVDCAHALWVVHSIKRLVSLMLLKWFLSDSFIYFMYRMFNENF